VDPVIGGSMPCVRGGSGRGAGCRRDQASTDLCVAVRGEHQCGHRSQVRLLAGQSFGHGQPRSI
jgi:hypothetical protein